MREFSEPVVCSNSATVGAEKTLRGLAQKPVVLVLGSITYD
jgi:hypothetical protein